MYEKVVIWGSGERAKNAIELIRKRKDYEIVCIWDNMKSKWGDELDGIRIVEPMTEVGDYQKIIICSVYYEEIKTQLVKDFGVNEEIIKNYTYCYEGIIKELDRKYKNCDEPEIKEVLVNMNRNGLRTFNYSFTDKYNDLQYNIFFDDIAKLFYYIWNGKKMYLKRSISTKNKALEYIKNLLIEQDKESPHRYFDGQYKIDKGDIVVDAGAAEGFFSLDALDNAEKICIIEPDVEWMEALHYTFFPYKDKIQIINKYLSRKDTENTITLNKIADMGNINLVKMDIEGYEEDALYGADNLLNKNGVKFLICTYHREDAAENIASLFRRYNFNIEFSKGYMFFMFGNVSKPYLTKGVLRASK